MPSGLVTGSVLSFTGAAPEDASNVNELARDRHDALRHDHVPEHHAHAPQQDYASPGSEVSHSCFPEIAFSSSASATSFFSWAFYLSSFFKRIV